MKPAKVLLTIPNFVTAGSGRALWNVASRLDRERFAPAIAVERRGGALEAEIEAAGVPLVEAAFTVAAKPYRGLLARARGAAAAFRPHGFEVWHSYHYLDDYTEPLVARLAGARFVYTKKNMNWHRRAWYLRSLLARRIAAQNRDMMRRFFASPPWRHKTRYLPRGVDTERFRPPEAGTETRLRERLGIASGAVLVGCVAQLVPVKGHPTLLDAVARLPEVELVLAGGPLEGEHPESLRRRAEKLGIAARVRFLGPLETGEVAALLRELDVFVLPTWNRWRVEGCPVALLEAMASGRAVVATDVAGSRDLVAPGCGRLVPPEDPEALAAALAELASSRELRAELGRAARRRVVEEFSIEREVARHEALYDEVLGRR